MPVTVPKAEREEQVVPNQRLTKDSINLEAFLVELVDSIKVTLDLDTLLRQVADAIRRVIDYEIFAILLLNERAQDLRMRFQIGHSPETERIRIKVGKGITGRAAEKREAILVNDVSLDAGYI